MGSMKLIDRLEELSKNAAGCVAELPDTSARDYIWELMGAYPDLRDVAWAAKFVSNSPDLKEHCPHLVKILNDTLKELDR